MKDNIKAVAIARFSSLWIFAFHSAGLKCLLVARHQFQPTQFTQEHFVGRLDRAQRDFNIGILWLLAVILFWSFKLSPTQKPNEKDRAA